jgi:hypothetical protein
MSANLPSYLSFGVPRACQGQTIEKSYAIDLAQGRVYLREHDHTDDSKKFSYCALTTEEMDALEYYDAGGESYPPDVSGNWMPLDADETT